MPIYNLNGSGTNSSTPNAPTTATVGVTSASVGTAVGKGFSLYNTGTTTIYFALGVAPVIAGAHTAKLIPGGYYEDAFFSIGAINAISSAAAGTLNVTIHA